MSNHHLWQHATHAAAHAANKGSKAGALALIIIGFFTAPMLIGVPLMIWGTLKLLK